ncbi:MAG: M14 family zinc carboxypeptidase [Lysobacter sp.]
MLSRPVAQPLRLSLLAGLLAVALPGLAQHAPLNTVSERSGFVETGRYDEVIRLCDAFATRYPDAVRCSEFGTTPEGRPMKMLVVSRSGALTAETARDIGVPVTLMQGGIHAGEIDGKDAGFLAIRQMLDGEVARGVLAQQVFVFVPVFNVDGHERFRAWNRPNQRGPKEMGWRTTAQNYNLNRDYVKADAPEMQAMLALINRWDPLVYVDLHVTNGAKFEHDISIQIEPVNSGDPDLRAVGLALRTGTINHLAAQGGLPLAFYPSFVEDDNPASGFKDGVSPPRFSHGYMPLRNRIGVLVETHSWREYPHRVESTRQAILGILGQVAAHGQAWQALTVAADRRAAKLAGKPVALSHIASDQCRTIEFKGYAYTRTPSEVSGASMTRYDETRPEVWKLPLCDDIRTELVVDAPKAGYLVPPAHAGWVGAKLDQHAIAYRRLDSKLPKTGVAAFRANQVTLASRSVEGHQMATVDGEWRRETHDIEAGALFVPIAQPKARLVMAMLEPKAPDSLASWGEFNNAFERKEYMEDYVAEEVARDMLGSNRKLKAEFEQRLRDDPAFAADPGARLDFFFRRHPSWDERYNLYPVLRVDRTPR